MTTLTDEELGTTSSATTYADTNQVYRGTFEGRLVGTATSAKQLETPFKLELQGDVAGNVDISGKQGVILQTKVSHATEADRADFAGNTALAANANYADLANLANYAVESGHAKETEYSKESDHAKESDHSLTADRADIADKALLSDRATIADRAYKADSAIKDNKGNVIDETYAVDKDLLHKDEYLTNAIIQGLATGTGTIDERTLTITIDKIASSGLTIFEFSPFPTTEEDRDTTKIYVSQANKQFYIFNTETSKWENLFNTFNTAINNLATKHNTDVQSLLNSIQSTKTELQNSINSNKTATDKTISGLEKNLKLLIQNNKDYAEDRYVKKSGDTLTGILTSNNPYVTSHSLAIAHKVDGDNKNYYNGGCLFLFSPDDPTYNGGFELRAYNADDNRNYIGLRGNLDGKLTWNGKNIVRSVNGVNADSNGNVSITTIANATNATKATQDSVGNVITSTYVKKVGDTLTGSLVSNSAYYTSNELALAHYEKSGYDGGNLFLFPVDNDGYYDGGFSLRAKNGSDYIGLSGDINGLLTWNDKNIVRSVNGVNADSNGNVSLPRVLNYSNKIEFRGDNVTYTCPSDGWIIMLGYPESSINKTGYIRVNNVLVGMCYLYRDEMWNNGINVQMMVTKGDVVTTDFVLGGANFYFIPFK